MFGGPVKALNSVLVLLAVTMTTSLGSAQNVDRDEDLLIESEGLLTDVIYKGENVPSKDPVGLVTMKINPQYKSSSGLPGMNLTLCSGTLIAADVVLTAGHCVQNILKMEPKMRASIVVDIEYRGLDGKQKHATMKDAVVHSKFEGGVGPNDIALIRLTTPITDRKPVALAQAAAFDAEKALTVAGYGRNERPEIEAGDLMKDPRVKKLLADAKKIPDTEEGKKKKTEMLATLMKIANEVADRNVLLLRATMTGKLLPLQGSTMLQISNPERYICKGDSGGPTYVTVGGKLAVVGVHSGASKEACTDEAQRGFIGKMFAKQMLGLDVFVPNHLNWIKARMDEWKKQRDI